MWSGRPNNGEFPGEFSWIKIDRDPNAIYISQWVAGFMKKTNVISNIMEDFGGRIPSEYHVREEETMVFRCFVKEWKASRSKPS